MDALNIIKQMPAEFSLKLNANGPQSNLVEKRKQKIINKENKGQVTDKK